VAELDLFSFCSVLLVALSGPTLAVVGDFLKTSTLSIAKKRECAHEIDVRRSIEAVGQFLENDFKILQEIYRLLCEIEHDILIYTPCT
jgi:hypothetical protein